MPLPSTLVDLAFARCLQKEEEYCAKLKPPPPPTGDYEMAFCLNEEEETLKEIIWKNAPSFKNPEKKRKQSQLTQIFLKR